MLETPINLSVGRTSSSSCSGRLVECGDATGAFHGTERDTLRLSGYLGITSGYSTQKEEEYNAN